MHLHGMFDSTDTFEAELETVLGKTCSRSRGCIPFTRIASRGREEWPRAGTTYVQRSTFTADACLHARAYLGRICADSWSQTHSAQQTRNSEQSKEDASG